MTSGPLPLNVIAATQSVSAPGLSTWLRRDVGTARTVRRIGPLVAACLLFCSGNALAQRVAAPHAVDPKLSAFDAAVVGYEGLTIDFAVVNYLYNQPDPAITEMEKNIRIEKETIAGLQDHPRPDAQSRIDELTKDIEVDQSYLDALKRAKKLAADDGTCGSAEKIKDWETLIQFLQNDMVKENRYMSQSKESDTRAHFIWAVARDHHLLADATGWIIEIKEACNKLKSQRFLEIPEGTTDTSEAIRQADAENIAQGNADAAHAFVIALALAKRGRFDDLPAIREQIWPIETLARANQLRGNDIGLRQQQMLFDVLRAFATEAFATCRDQSFSPEEVMGIQRQVQLSGVGDIASGVGATDMAQCLPRVYEGGGGQMPDNTFVAFRVCSTTFDGDWQVRLRSKTQNLSGDVPVSGVVQVNGGRGNVTLAGRITPNDGVTLPYDVNIHGTVALARREFRTPQGILNGTLVKHDHEAVGRRACGNDNCGWP